MMNDKRPAEYKTPVIQHKGTPLLIGEKAKKESSFAKEKIVIIREKEEDSFSEEDSFDSSVSWSETEVIPPTNIMLGAASVTLSEEGNQSSSAMESNEQTIEKKTNEKPKVRKKKKQMPRVEYTNTIQNVPPPSTPPIKKKRKVKSVGRMINKGDKSYELMFDMLLGIRVSVSKVSAMNLRAKLSPKECREIENYFIPSSGTTHTPAHPGRDFGFRDYAPKLFRHLREKNGIDSADYLMSLTGDYILSEIVSPGKSGSFFYFSHDTKYMLKTITPSEKSFLKKILRSYYLHIVNNPNTMIIRFYGFHMVHPHGGPKMHFVVMGNIFAQSLEIHERYDLKGSTIGRTVGEEKLKNLKPTTILKDLDFQRHLILGPEKRALFFDQLEKDALWLQRMDIMDYSLLLGIYSLKKKQELQKQKEENRESNNYNNDDTDESFSDSDEEINQNDVLPPSIFVQDRGGFGATDENNNAVPEIYFIGIIDILQPYNLTKQGEHIWKAGVLRMNKNEISSVNPHAYARRFIKFIEDHVSTEGAAELQLLYEREEERKIEIIPSKKHKKDKKKEKDKEEKKEKKKKEERKEKKEKDKDKDEKKEERKERKDREKDKEEKKEKEKERDEKKEKREKDKDREERKEKKEKKKEKKEKIKIIERHRHSESDEGEDRDSD